MNLFLRTVLVSALAAAMPLFPQSQSAFDLLRNGDVASVMAMVEKSPELVEARDAQGDTLLHYAASGRDTALIDFLVSKGAKVDHAGGRAKTPLHIAAANDRTEAAAALVKNGAALEIGDDYERTALILCARERGQAATARLLLDAGADINAADKFGSTALELAAWRGKTETVDLLLERGARVPDSGEIWANMLTEATSHGLDNLFRRLTAGGQDLKALDPAGGRILQTAAAGGSAGIVASLIDRGFAPAQADRFGWTPLHHAARDGRTEAARILLERGAPLDARTVMGQTAYNVAVERKMGAVAAFLVEKGADQSDIRFPVLEGDYLGQTPPADTPKLFAPGIISSIWGLHSTAVFSPDGTEVWWAPMVGFPGEIYSKGGLLMMKRVEGRWTPPAWAPFSGPNGQDDVPFFSADGKRLYFISRRPLPGESQGGSERIWTTDRTPEGWTEPRPLDPRVNAVDKHWQFSLDRAGDLYFAGRPPDSRGRSDIYVARFKDGAYESPANLGDPINTPEVDDTPFIAPDGSYLLFSQQFDLWVSFRGTDGTWGHAVNLGPKVNSPSIELCPMVTADGKYLFFLSQRHGESHAYWVSTKVIDDLRDAAILSANIRSEAAQEGCSVSLQRRLYDEHSAGYGMSNLLFRKTEDSTGFPPDWSEIEEADLFRNPEMEPVKVFRYRSGGAAIRYAVDAAGTGKPEKFEALEFRPSGKDLLVADVSVPVIPKAGDPGSPVVMAYQIIRADKEGYSYSQIADYREGRIEIEGEVFAVQLHRGGPGHFTYSAETSTCLIDLNHDGTFQPQTILQEDGSLLEGERIDLSGPFFLGRRPWRSAVLSPDGNRWDLVPSSDRTAPIVGFQAPDFAFQDLKGRPGRLDQFRGQTVLLQFWSTNCHWSREIRPAMNALIDRDRGAPLVVLSVAFNSGSVADIEAFQAETPMGGRIVVAEDSSLAAFNRRKISPLFYLIDPQSMIRYVGFGGRQVPILQKMLDDLGSGRDAGRPLQQRYAKLAAEAGHISAVLKAGAEKARPLAEKTIARVKERMGLG